MFKFILISALICLQSSVFFFNMRKKLWRYTSYSSTCFWFYRKNPTNTNKIYQIPSASFSGGRFNSDLAKLQWTPPLFIFNLIRDFSNKRKLFTIPVAEESMLLFHVLIERFKLIYYSLIFNFSKHFFKIGIICLIFLSFHLFTALEFDSNYFGIFEK